MTNRVRQRREELALSQRALADGIGLSRQSLTAIESGRTTPSVAVALRIARALGADVEALFAPAANDELEVSLAQTVKEPEERVIVGCVREQWVAHPLASSRFAPSQYAADGFVRKLRRGGRAQVEVLRAPADLRDNVLVGGCAPGLNVLADRLNGARGPGRFRWLMQSNVSALEGLSRGHTHVAGVHLARSTPTKLAQTVARYLPTSRGEVIALATWEAGLVVARGNPRRIVTMSDVMQPRLRVALREPGSGARRELERLLRREGADPAALALRSFEVRGHMDVAHAVALGAADTGFSIRAAAVALQLDFVPFVEERFDLIVPDDLRGDARVVRLLDVLASSAFRRELDSLGYDTRRCGDKIADVSAT